MRWLAAFDQRQSRRSFPFSARPTAAFVTLATIDAKSPSQGVLLKVQSGSISDGGAISVVYDAVAKAVRVSTLH